ncbi:thiosulfate/3-mercaptopyruvate sulfurtransferase [Stackebrandtia endophytica]|uniref:Thiosulfate/3-mercaptopyruvate sulfurtransferase n=1 Tax=Stackebrandtia endophytica TaxID=1496996 RepID=A0A543B320_9ACTN|nr:sulfurtransferase [Stackebrandtia endophytica]TQL79192.1 thiosulfate/3-mercaptopyruvate sulfurtransferase [Stackebrandtia endophytica]
MALLSVDEFTELATDRPVLLDVRWSLANGSERAGYEAGHLAGAVFLDFDAEVCGPPGPNGRHPLPDPAQLQAALRRVGVHDDSVIVVYDGGDLMAASRTWWTLQWAGLTRVHVLDGGYPAASAAGLPIDGDEPAATTGTVTVDPGRLPVVDAAEAAAMAQRGGLYDVRTAARFRGDAGVIDPVAGHVPGAANLPGEQVLTTDADRMRPIPELSTLFDGIDTTDCAVYCGSGVTAARTALAMTVAGLATPAIYIGSWSHWIADSARPVATGDV